MDMSRLKTNRPPHKKISRHPRKSSITVENYIKVKEDKVKDIRNYSLRRMEEIVTEAKRRA
jgi:hypothetical protein